VNVKIHWNKDAYGDPGLGFVLSLERLVEERLRVPLQRVYQQFGGLRGL